MERTKSEFDSIVKVLAWKWDLSSIFALFNAKMQWFQASVSSASVWMSNLLFLNEIKWQVFQNDEIAWFFSKLTVFIDEHDQATLISDRFNALKFSS